MRLLRTNTVLNGFARKARYCVRISTVLRVKRLMLTRYGFARKNESLNTDENSFAPKATYALEATYTYKIRLLIVKLLMLQSISFTGRCGDDISEP